MSTSPLPLMKTMLGRNSHCCNVLLLHAVFSKGKPTLLVSIKRPRDQPLAISPPRNVPKTATRKLAPHSQLVCYNTASLFDYTRVVNRPWSFVVFSKFHAWNSRIPQLEALGYHSKHSSSHPRMTGVIWGPHAWGPITNPNWEWFCRYPRIVHHLSHYSCINIP